MFVAYVLIIAACLIAVIVNRRFFYHYYLVWKWLLIWTLLIELLRYLVNQDIFLGIVQDRFEVSIDKSNKFKFLLGHIYQPVEFSLLLLLYSKNLQLSYFRRYYPYLISLFWIISLVFFIYEGPTSFNQGSQLIEDAIITGVALLYSYHLITETTNQGGLLRNTFFWINTGNLFFFSGTFFYITFHEAIYSMSADIAHQLSFIMMLLNYMLYLLYLIGAIVPTRGG